MDILAHGLWAAAASKAVNNRRRDKAPLNLRWTAFWGIFPDLFAFAVPWVLIITGILSGNINPSTIPGPASLEPPTPTEFPAFIFNLATALYNISHSLVIFGIAFLAVGVIRKRAPWEMGGWLLHVLMDVPTHTSAFFPTPVFWPVSAWQFPYGIPWHHASFLIPHYILLLFVYLFLWRKQIFKRHA